jgi:hypothetical protein
MTLHGYTDADYASNDKFKWRSTSGWVFFLCGGVISHSAKRQDCVALSTTESEVFGLCKAAQEAAWLRIILKGLTYWGPDAKSVKIYGDNQASLALAENPELHQRTKHVATKLCYVREQNEKGRLNLWYCNTKDMVADGLTKPLGRLKHQRFVELLGLQVLSPQFRSACAIKMCDSYDWSSQAENRGA